jgi:hypothetical protein
MVLFLNKVGIAIQCPAAIFNHETSLTVSRNVAWSFQSRPGISRPGKNTNLARPGTKARDVASRVVPITIPIPCLSLLCSTNGKLDWGAFFVRPGQGRQIGMNQGCFSANDHLFDGVKRLKA